MAGAPRFLGIDEGPFTFADEAVPVAAVLTRGAYVVEAVAVDRVAVDGWDATESVVRLAKRLPGAGPGAIIVSGITLGGMNLVDCAAAARTLGVPVLGVTRREPAAAGLSRAAMRAPESARRHRQLPARAPVAVSIAGRRLWVHADAPDGPVTADEEIARILAPAMGESTVPEPLRLAHHIATAIVRGTSGTPP